MTISSLANVLALRDQCVNQIEHNEALNKIIIHCHRDKHFKAIDSLAGVIGTMNH